MRKAARRLPPGVDERTKIAKKVAAAGDRWLRKLPEGGIWGG